MDDVIKKNKGPARINMQRVGELASQLKQRMISKVRFRFNMPTEQALNLLTAFYKLEVENRQREFRLDENTLSNLTKLAEYLTAETPRFGIMLSGTCGNGKSTLMLAFQRALNFLAERRHFNFMDEYFQPRMTVYDAWELSQIARDPKDFAIIKQKPMIGIDDMGTEPAEVLEFGNPVYPVVRLIEYRYNTQAFTFITTNLTPQEIRKKYGDRIADRFNEMLHVIVFQDGSYRR